jgi:hypothetical protein
MADNNPYIGPGSFEEKDRSRFFGRDEEARELSYLLIAWRAVLLYAQSGAGKTSLLQAKVVPDLVESGEMHVLPITRVSGSAEGGNVYVANALAGLNLKAANLTDALASFFTETEDGEGQIPHLLIFDQFEEIFTFRPELGSQRRAFFEQLRDCLAAYPKLGLLLSMREDYLADMDSFAGYLPDRLRTRMRMERLSDEQAEDAIARPAAGAGKPFDAGVARRLVNDLRRVQTSRTASASATNDGHALGNYVEPVQLQIVCRQLWSKLPDTAPTITAQHVETLARVDDALTGFYRDALAAVRAKQPELSERTLREWFGKRLITSAKTRGTVYEGESETEGLPNSAVEVLRERNTSCAPMSAPAAPGTNWRTTAWWNQSWRITSNGGATTGTRSRTGGWPAAAVTVRSSFAPKTSWASRSSSTATSRGSRRTAARYRRWGYCPMGSQRRRRRLDQALARKTSRASRVLTFRAARSGA